MTTITQSCAMLVLAVFAARPSPSTTTDYPVVEVNAPPKLPHAWIAQAQLQETTPAPSTRSVTPAIALVSGLVSSQPCVVFAKSYCPFSNKARDTLLSVGARCLVLDLDWIDDAGWGIAGRDIQQALSTMTGRSTVPNVFIGGVSIGGGDDTVALHRQGGLHSRLIAAKAIRQSACGRTSSGDRRLGAEESAAALLLKQPCLLLGRVWCGDGEGESIRLHCKPHSAWTKNALLAVGARCTVVDADLQTENGDIHLTFPHQTPKSNRKLEYREALFGGELGLDGFSGRIVRGSYGGPGLLGCHHKRRHHRSHHHHVLNISSHHSHHYHRHNADRYQAHNTTVYRLHHAHNSTAHWHHHRPGTPARLQRQRSTDIDNRANHSAKPVGRRLSSALPQLSYSGALVLLKRGGCTFARKASVAKSLGAVGMVVFDNAPQNSSHLIQMTGGQQDELQTLDDFLAVFVTSKSGEYIADQIGHTKNISAVLRPAGNILTPLQHIAGRSDLPLLFVRSQSVSRNTLHNVATETFKHCRCVVRSIVHGKGDCMSNSSLISQHTIALKSLKRKLRSAGVLGANLRCNGTQPAFQPHAIAYTAVLRNTTSNVVPHVLNQSIALLSNAKPPTTPSTSTLPDTPTVHSTPQPTPHSTPRRTPHPKLLLTSLPTPQPIRQRTKQPTPQPSPQSIPYSAPKMSPQHKVDIPVASSLHHVMQPPSANVLLKLPLASSATTAPSTAPEETVQLHLSSLENILRSTGDNVQSMVSSTDASVETSVAELIANHTPPYVGNELHRLLGKHWALLVTALPVLTALVCLAIVRKRSYRRSRSLFRYSRLSPISGGDGSADEGDDKEESGANVGIEMQLGPDRLSNSVSDAEYYDGGVDDAGLDVEYGDINGCGDCAQMDSNCHDDMHIASTGVDSAVQPDTPVEPKVSDAHDE